MKHAITLHINMKTSSSTRGYSKVVMKIRLIIQQCTGDFDTLKSTIKKGIDNKPRGEKDEYWINRYPCTLDSAIQLEDIAKLTGMTFKEKEQLNIFSKSEHHLCNPPNSNGNQKKTSKPILYKILTHATKTAIAQTIKLLEEMNSFAAFSHDLRKDVVGMLVGSEKEFEKLCEPLSSSKEDNSFQLTM